MAKQNGVDMWPNAAIWMRDELRSKEYDKESLVYDTTQYSIQYSFNKSCDL